jgi:hypothetical protein
MAKIYAGVVGAVLLLVGICGFLTNSLMGLEFHMAHNIIHLATGVIGLWAAMASGGSNAGTFAKVFGIVYTLVAVMGFAGISDLGSIKLGLNTMYNVIHLAVGVLGIAAGFMGGGAAKAAGAGA